ncbi:homeobox KN domain-containing protein [Hyaloraphidium curvatum]|nr:homeobox KN domain-containing protein [Hyaloraphidium curvatum]
MADKRTTRHTEPAGPDKAPGTPAEALFDADVATVRPSSTKRATSERRQPSPSPAEKRGKRRATATTEDVDDVASRKKRPQRASDAHFDPDVTFVDDGGIEIAIADHEEYDYGYEPVLDRPKRSTARQLKYEESDDASRDFDSDSGGRRASKRGSRSSTAATPAKRNLRSAPRAGVQQPSGRMGHRANHPKETIDTLSDWMAAHTANPYPTEDEKAVLMEETGLNLRQVNDWFINARRRLLPKLLAAEASTEKERQRKAR